ncbi:MAG: UDP-N-acetylmuramate dehydrogenase [Endomicrobia bacterium]|nr:UDP-N-acetylmuramate dehydrogenase [Endomicrobiia bacterium]
MPNSAALGVFLAEAEKQNIRFYVLGGGTNVLFSDKGYDGAVIKLTGEFSAVNIKGNEVAAGAAAALPALVKAAAEKNLPGLECCAGIPGTVGGAVFGNAGSAEKWIGDAVSELTVWSVERGVWSERILKRDEIPFQYRSSGLEGCIITKVNFLLKNELEKDVLKEINEAIEKRIKSQSVGGSNAGCIFKNPAGLSAGKLIDDAGLKGKKKGGAEISKVHANFIINNGNAKASDVLDLIYAARKTVKEKFNIDLELEIKIV